MKSIVFDAGPIISLTTNNLLWLLQELKYDFGGEFYIPVGVREELIDKPMKTKKYKFEALQVNSTVREGILTIIETLQIKALTEELLELINHTYKVRGNWLRLVHYGEMETLATAVVQNSQAVVIDERTARLLVEDEERMVETLGRKFRAKITINQKNRVKFKKWIAHLKVIRSTELVTIAYEKGLLDKFLLDSPNAKRLLIESLLWGVKLHGCSVTRDEIDDIVRLEQ